MFLLQADTEFLGLVVCQDEILVHPQKLSVIQNWPRPMNLFKLRSFLGLLQFFRRSIPKVLSRAAPLTVFRQLRSGILKRDTDAQAAFVDLKEALVNAPILVAQDWSRTFPVHITASRFAVGATLTQCDDERCDHVILYTSRKLMASEQNFTANERGL